VHGFLFAETCQDLSLLFALPETLRFDSVVFNTDAHSQGSRVALLVLDRSFQNL
jgi:hypothetical protein